ATTACSCRSKPTPQDVRATAPRAAERLRSSQWCPHSQQQDRAAASEQQLLKCDEQVSENRKTQTEVENVYKPLGLSGVSSRESPRPDQPGYVEMQGSARRKSDELDDFERTHTLAASSIMIRSRPGSSQPLSSSQQFA